MVYFQIDEIENLNDHNEQNIFEPESEGIIENIILENVDPSL